MLSGLYILVVTDSFTFWFLGRPVNPKRALGVSCSECHILWGFSFTSSHSTVHRQAQLWNQPPFGRKTPIPFHRSTNRHLGGSLLPCCCCHSKPQSLAPTMLRSRWTVMDGCYQKGFFDMFWCDHCCCCHIVAVAEATRKSCATMVRTFLVDVLWGLDKIIENWNEKQCSKRRHCGV